MLREGREQAIPRVHPAQKPVALMKWCLTQVTASSVLDPFMGSATTLIAAKEMGLTAIGIEIEERYCEIAAKRLSQEVFQFSEVAKSDKV
jgi:DNA modification methylase